MLEIDMIIFWRNILIGYLPLCFFSTLFFPSIFSSMWITLSREEGRPRCTLTHHRYSQQASHVSHGMATFSSSCSPDCIFDSFTYSPGGEIKSVIKAFLLPLQQTSSATD